MNNLLKYMFEHDENWIYSNNAGFIIERKQPMEEKVGNVHAIRNFMIKTVKRYITDMDLMKSVVVQNQDAFDTKKDILEQFDRVKNDLKAILDYNFYEVELEVTEKE